SHRGRGECVPYARYGETVEGVAGAIAAVSSGISPGLYRERPPSPPPAGAARHPPPRALLGIAGHSAPRAGGAALHPPPAPPRPVTPAYPTPLATPDAMAQAAAAAAARALIKVKLGAPGDPARIAAVRLAAPRAELIVDANEGWTPHDLAANFAACAQAGV